MTSSDYELDLVAWEDQRLLLEAQQEVDAMFPNTQPIAPTAGPYFGSDTSIVLP